MAKKKYAIIDIETTGGMATRDRITEIGIVIHDGEGLLMNTRASSILDDLYHLILLELQVLQMTWSLVLPSFMKLQKLLSK